MASDLGLHCLPMPHKKYGLFYIIVPVGAVSTAYHSTRYGSAVAQL